jgi:succinate dehydrogenase / fumarate reductase, iron-sulfur subunit
MHVTLKVWRQKSAVDAGQFVTYEVNDVSEHMSFLEMLDVLNEDLIRRDEDPIVFDSDCREGICGTCGFMINGVAHGPNAATTVCQLHMRFFKDGDTVVLEPWRASAFPVLKDLAGLFPWIRAARRRRTARWCPRATPMARLMPRSASAAERAWLPARTLRACCSCPPKRRTWGCCRRVNPSDGGACGVWSLGTTPRASGTAAITASAKPCVPKSSPWK